MALTTEWWVYVIQSQAPRFNKKGQRLPGFYYVGSTTDHRRRLREHNGELKGGGKYTSQHRPWRMRALFGPYSNRSEAFKAEMALKRGKRGEARCFWSPRDNSWCRGLGVNDPRVEEANRACTSALVANPAPEDGPPRKGIPDGSTPRSTSRQARKPPPKDES
jgi:predicted GIY-YIG superfamily endonuclease